MKIERYCVVCNSNNKTVLFQDKVFCGKHYLQMKRHGKTFERTTFDKNEYEIKDNVIYISTYDRKGEFKNKFIVSLEFLELIKNHKWVSNKENYIVTTIDKKTTYLHRLIVSAQTDDYVDHINHNTLDNRVENLRICSNSENLMNRGKVPSSNSSGVIGVIFINERNKWRSEIVIPKTKRNKFLGYYTNKDDAIKARREAELKYFGEFAPNQVLFEKYNIIECEEIANEN